MPSDGSYQTAEGSSRKRLKISRDAGRSAGVSKSPETVDLVTPAKLEPSAPMIKTESEVKSPTNNTCRHEQSLRSLHDDLDAMRHLITCKICQRFLYEPYALTCGHTFCYSCLSQWMGQNKTKTCPDCRTVIRDEPAPSYLIRELVLIFVGRSALLLDGETAEEHSQLAKEEADIVARDKANTHVETGGLFKGSFKKGTRRAPVEGIRDHSDNVYRCPECTSEVEDGRCSGCGIRVRTQEDGLAWSSDDESIDSDELELDHELEAEDYDDDTELGLVDGHADVWDPYQQGHPPWHHDQGEFPPAPSSDVDLSQDEHDEFMDGFIDDEPIRDAYWNSDEEEGDQSEATEVNNNAPQRRQRYEEVSESDEEEEEDEAPAQPRRRRELAVRVPPRLDSEGPSSAAASMVSDPSDSDRDDSEEEEDEEPIRTNQHNRGRRAPARSHRVVTVRSDDEDSDAETHATDLPGAGGFSPIQPAPQQHQHINYYDDSDVESDGDDEETEQEHDHDDFQHRDEYGNNYDQYGEDYGGEESDDGYDDQSTRAQVPSTGSFNHRLHILGPHSRRHANITASPPSHGSLYPDDRRAVQAFSRRYAYDPRQELARSAAALNEQYRPPNLTYRHPFNLDNTLAGIRQRTEPLRGRDGGRAAGRDNNYSAFSSQSSAGGVDVSSQGSGSSASSRTVR